MFDYFEDIEFCGKYNNELPQNMKTLFYGKIYEME